MAWDAGSPEQLEKLVGYRMTNGQCFDNRDEAYLAMCQMAESENRRHSFAAIPSVFTGRFSRTQLKARCHMEDCTFRLTVRKTTNTNNVWKVGESINHSCQPHSPNSRQSRTAYSPKMFTSLISHRIAEGLQCSSREVRCVLSPYLRLEPSRSFVLRVRDASYKAYGGESSNILGILPSYVAKLNYLGHNAKLIMNPREDMVSVALRVALENHKKGPDKDSVFDAVSVREHLEKNADKASYFYAAMFVSKIARDMISMLVPVFSADAAHCTGPSKGTLFSLYGSDVNHRQVLLSLMIVADNECEDTWSMFLEFAYQSLGFNWSGVRIITDQDKGARKAIDKHLSGAKRFLCAMHRKTNVYKNCDVITGKAFGEAVHTYTMASLNDAKGKYSPAGNAYISKVPDCEQYPLGCGHLYGKVSSQGVESMNNALKNVRGMSAAAAFITSIQDDQRRHIKAATYARQLRSEDHPQAVKKQLDSVEFYSRKNNMPVVFTNVEKTKCRVPSSQTYLHSYDVDLEGRSCTCGKWNMTMFPCSHAAKACRAANVNLKMCLSSFHETKMLKQQYSVDEYVLPATNNHEIDEDVAPPLAVPPTRGRPRKRRRIGALEATKSRRCGRCGTRSHNVRTCPLSQGAVSTQ